MPLGKYVFASLQYVYRRVEVLAHMLCIYVTLADVAKQWLYQLPFSEHSVRD